MARGLRAACQAVAEQHLGTGDASCAAGATWADQGDRSSGVLWGRHKALRAGIDAVIGSKGARDAGTALPTRWCRSWRCSRGAPPRIPRCPRRTSR